MGVRLIQHDHRPWTVRHPGTNLIWMKWCIVASQVVVSVVVFMNRRGIETSLVHICILENIHYKNNILMYMMNCVEFMLPSQVVGTRSLHSWLLKQGAEWLYSRTTLSAVQQINGSGHPTEGLDNCERNSNPQESWQEISLQLPPH